jgi:hypothetical protein
MAVTFLSDFGILPTILPGETPIANASQQKHWGICDQEH